MSRFGTLSGFWIVTIVIRQSAATGASAPGSQGTQMQIGAVRSDFSSKGATDPFDFLKAILSGLGPDKSGEPACLGSMLDADFKTLRPQISAQSAYHGVTLLIEPAVRCFFEQENDRASLADKRQFFALATRHRGLAAAREKSIDILLEAFALAGIRVLLLKGAALAHLIYASPELRPSLDIDILIDEAQKENAIETARSIGYGFESRHPSRFSGEAHHLPVATGVQSGFQIFLEIHTDALSSDHSERMKFADLSIHARSFERGAGPAGLAPGHTDMLRHLVRHAFGPARRTRLIHLYDLWRYESTFRSEIDWDDIEERFNYIMVVLKMVSLAFGNVRDTTSAISGGVGLGFIPLSETLASNDRLAEKLSNIFNPPSWWMHGFYGIPPEKSLLVTRLYRHPLTLIRWLSTRVLNGAKSIGEKRSGDISISTAKRNNRDQQ